MLQAWRQGTNAKAKGKGKRDSYDAQSQGSHGNKGMGKRRDQASYGVAHAQDGCKGKGKGAYHPVGGQDSWYSVDVQGVPPQTPYNPGQWHGSGTAFLQMAWQNQQW